MNEISIRENQLPDNLHDLAAFVLVGREKLTAVRAEIRAIDKLQLAEDVRQQKRDEAFMLSEALLDAEKRIGELTKQIPKATSVSGNQYTDKWKNDSGVKNPKPKSEVIKDLGFTPKQVERFEVLANNPDVVEEVKQEARENDDLPTRSRVIDLVKQREREQDETKKREAESSRLYRKFHNALFDILLLYDDETEIEYEKLEMLTDWIEDCKGITVKDYISDIGNAIERLEIIRAYFTRHERSKNNG